jgi:hypothetical protein
MGVAVNSEFIAHEYTPADIQLSLGKYYIYHLFPASTKSLALRG